MVDLSRRRWKAGTGRAKGAKAQKAQNPSGKQVNNQGTKAQRESGNQREFFRANGSDL